jgi:hypothetical protein
MTGKGGKGIPTGQAGPRPGQTKNPANPSAGIGKRNSPETVTVETGLPCPKNGGPGIGPP